MSGSPTILVVDDERVQAETLRNVLALEGFAVTVATSVEDARTSARSRAFDLVISDLRMPGGTGLDLYRALSADRPDLLFFLLTAYGSIDDAVAAFKAGVSDFLTKPVDTSELIIRIRKALRLRHLESENRDLRRTLETLREPVEIVGGSSGIRKILDSLDRISASTATVLIEGESGTGKELVARAIHERSPRAGGPYVKVNCAAIPENLLEDELFGHEKGAFTGAIAARRGRFELAHRGSIFLDEIGDMPLHLQTKLTRVLQEREFERIGGSETVRVDVRVIAATHRNLAEMAGRGEFREDLFYRLNVIPIVIPPLRDRAEDIPDLAAHFLARFAESHGRSLAGFTDVALRTLRAHAWPGNVRELQNCIERAVVMARGDVVGADDIMIPAAPGHRGAGGPEWIDRLVAAGMTLDGLERELILAALDRTGRNLSQAARLLGLTRRTLQYRLDKIRAGGGQREGSPGAGGKGDEDPLP